MPHAGRPRRSRIAVLTVFLSLLALLTALPGPIGATSAHAADTADASLVGGNWSSWSYDQAGSRSNRYERTLNPSNVSGLTLKWAFGHAKIPGVFLGSQPAVVDGTLYTGGADATFHALDAKTGAAKWTFDLTKVVGPITDRPDPVRDGAAVQGDTVYFGDNHGRLYALNKKTGALLWSTQLDNHPTAQITSSPLVYHGRVYVGVSSAESGYTTDHNYPCCTFRGSLVAVNATNGALVWRHWTVPQPQQTGTWPSGAARFEPSGGAVWSTPIVDPGSDTVYVGTGQNYTGTSAGDYDSVLAVNATTGDVRWRQRSPFPDTYTVVCDSGDASYCPGLTNGSSHDWDFGASANLFTVNHRTLLGIGRKNGTYYVYDAKTGAEVWHKELSPNNNVPGGSAGIQWGTSFDGSKLYVATWFANPGTLYALSPATGDIVWQTPNPADGCTTGGAAQFQAYCSLALTPAVTTTPGLVYEGSTDGKMRVFSSATGKVLWQYDAVRDFTTVNGVPGHGTAISGNGGAVVSNGMLYVQAAYYPQYPSSAGGVLLAFSLR